VVVSTPPISRRLPRWQLAIIVAVVAAFTAYVLESLFTSAPEPESLARSTVTLATPVQLVNATGKSRGPYAVFAWADGAATVEHLCFLSGCALPAPLAALKAGDRVTLSLAADNVWQVEQGGRVALHYEDTRAAYEDAMRRRCVFSIPLWAAAVALLVVVLARRGKSEQD
jgi:hypothetical protein